MTYYPRIIAQRGSTDYMVLVNDTDCVVVSTVSKEVTKPYNYQSILRGGYWHNFDEQLLSVLSLVQPTTKEFKPAIIIHKAGMGNMEGLAKHLADKLGGDPHFFDNCMGCEELKDYDEEARSGICADAHKMVTGHWPAQDKKEFHNTTKLTVGWKQNEPLAILSLKSLRNKEGQGKGNWGHAGRPGEVGGSSPAGEGGGNSKRIVYVGGPTHDKVSAQVVAKLKAAGFKKYGVGTFIKKDRGYTFKIGSQASIGFKNLTLYIWNAAGTRNDFVDVKDWDEAIRVSNTYTPSWEKEYKALPKHQEGEPKTAPKGYPEENAQYADPANKSWPIDEKHIRGAVSYWNKRKGTEKYSPEEKAAVAGRICKAANKLIGPGHKYNPKTGKIDLEGEAKEYYADAILTITKGGSGSGNFGHAGRPGEVGGSEPAGEGGQSKPSVQDKSRAVREVRREVSKWKSNTDVWAYRDMIQRAAFHIFGSDANPSGTLSTPYSAPGKNKWLMSYYKKLAQRILDAPDEKLLEYYENSDGDI